MNGTTMTSWRIRLWCVAILVAKISGNPEGDPKGVLVEQCGTVLVTGQFLLVNTQFTVEPYFDALDAIVNRVNLSLSRAESRRVNLLKRNDPGDAKLFDVIITTLEGIYRMSSEFEGGFREFMSTVGSQRTKRGAIDGVGNVMKLLFGVSTEGDVEELHDQLEVLNDVAGRLVEEVNLHSMLLNKSINDLVNLSEKMDAIHSNLDLLDKRVHHLFYEVTSLYEATFLDVISVQMSNALYAVENSLMKLKNAIGSVFGGVVDPELVRPKTMLSLLQQAQLLPSLKLPFPPHFQFIPHYFSISYAVSKRLSLNEFSLKILIPTLSLAEPMVLYEMVPLPIPVNNSLILHIHLETRYLAVTDDHKRMKPHPSS